MGRWLRPEMGRDMVLNPEVRVNQTNRGTAVRENHVEGEKYADHRFRKFLRSRRPEVMPNLNRFFSKDQKDN
ncbi:hypothetical protein Pint_18971 [Pistacia integerrima]|uniref:Uncharacterized protein n=1 Tax=Pistacia integerrima TaxID=434235 RepID=A0ACC0Z1A7_9ROSI|nr:hypothetical protein Pint_18971 [Pistacia integerrima]